MSTGRESLRFDSRPWFGELPRRVWTALVTWAELGKTPGSVAGYRSVARAGRW